MFRGKERRFARARASAATPGRMLAKAAVLLLIVFAGLLGSASGAPVSILLPIEATFSSKVTPRKLPVRGRAPVSLELAERIGSRDGSHPPPLQELDIGLDRHLGLSVKGLPRCGPTLQDHGPRESALARCEEAKIGSGRIEVEVAFPEQQPVRTSGRVVVYNGGVSGGRTRIWLYSLIAAPVAGAVFMPLDVRRHSDGIYGWSGTLSMPKIADGAGSVTHLGINLQRGIFSAGCPTGRWQSQGSARLADGTVSTSAFVQRCRTAASG